MDENKQIELFNNFEIFTFKKIFQKFDCYDEVTWNSKLKRISSFKVSNNQGKIIYKHISSLSKSKKSKLLKAFKEISSLSDKKGKFFLLKVANEKDLKIKYQKKSEFEIAANIYIENEDVFYLAKEESDVFNENNIIEVKNRRLYFLNISVYLTKTEYKFMKLLYDNSNEKINIAILVGKDNDINSLSNFKRINNHARKIRNDVLIKLVLELKKRNLFDAIIGYYELNNLDNSIMIECFYDLIIEICDDRGKKAENKFATSKKYYKLKTDFFSD